MNDSPCPWSVPPARPCRSNRGTSGQSRSACFSIRDFLKLTGLAVFSLNADRSSNVCTVKPPEMMRIPSSLRGFKNQRHTNRPNPPRSRLPQSFDSSAYLILSRRAEIIRDRDLDDRDRERPVGIGKHQFEGDENACTAVSRFPMGFSRLTYRDQSQQLPSACSWFCRRALCSL